MPKNRPKKNRAAAATRAQGKLREEQRIEKVLRALEDDYERIREERSNKGVQIAVFRSKATPFGAAVAVVRMSKADIKSGDTVMSQLNPELDYARRAGLEVGHIIVVTECSGGNAYWQRPDLNEVERLIAEGICRHVIWLDVTRMARERRTFLDHADLLEQHGIGLHIAQQNRLVNLHDFGDRMMLAIQVEFAVFERLLTKERTQRGIWDQLILSGKGFFPHPPYGFEFDDDGWLRPYEPEWRWMKAMHYGLIEFRREDGSGYPKLVELFQQAGSTITEDDIRKELDGTRRDRLGLRAFADIITLAGQEMSAARLSNILNDAIYVDGIPVNEIGGIKVAMKQIALDDPIPSDVYARNQQILEVANAASIKVRLADFGLIDVIRCGVCGQKLQPYFGGKHHDRRGYRHRDREIPDSCRGVVYWLDEIEPTIIRELHALDWDEDRRYRYFELARALDSDEDYWKEKKREKTRLRWAYRHAVEEAQPLLLQAAELSVQFAANGGADPLAYTRALADFHERPDVKGQLSELERMKRQLDLFDSIARQQRRSRPRIEIFDPHLAAQLPKVMTVEIPHGLEARLDRKRAINACLSAAHVQPALSELGDACWEIRLEGPLGPSDARLGQPSAPSNAARPVLEKVIRTVQQSYDYLTVQMMVSASGRAAFLKSEGATTPRQERRRDIPDWISSPIRVPRTP